MLYIRKIVEYCGVYLVGIDCPNDDEASKT